MIVYLAYIVLLYVSKKRKTEWLPHSLFPFRFGHKEIRGYLKLYSAPQSYITAKVETFAMADAMRIVWNYIVYPCTLHLEQNEVWASRQELPWNRQNQIFNLFCQMEGIRKKMNIWWRRLGDRHDFVSGFRIEESEYVMVLLSV